MTLLQPIDGGDLACAVCQSGFVHHGRVIIHDRNEDEPTVSTVVRGKPSEDMPKNPSARRSGITIEYWCEMCHSHCVFGIAQHKGNTLFSNEVIENGENCKCESCMEDKNKLSDFWNWVIEEQDEDNPRGDFIRDTRRIVQKGEDPSTWITSADGVVVDEYEKLKKEFDNLDTEPPF